MNNQTLEIAREVALEVSLKFLDKTNNKVAHDVLMQVTNKISQWILKNGENKSITIPRQAALHRAVLSVGIITDKPIATSKELLELADQYFNYFTH